MAEPPATSELDAYRGEADRFVASLNEEYYLHLSGQKSRLVLAAIYDRHESLTTLAACRDLSEAGSTELWRFACEGHLGNLTRNQEERLSELETSLEADVDGEPIGYRMLRPAIANEPDRERRERLERARTGLVEQLNPVLGEALEKTAEAARELGGSTYRELYEAFGFRLGELGAACGRFLAETEDLHVAAFDGLLRSRLGLSLEDVRRADVPRLLRGTAWDGGFPADGMLPALEATLGDLGIDLRGQRNVELDLERRPQKSPRAYCFPIEVPGRVVLMIQPIGGLDDWNALFHEAGHTEHFAHTSSSLPFESRRLGDNAVTEAWAFLLEHLVADQAWLTRRLNFGRPEEFTAEAAAVTLYFVRRYAGKLLYELELHGDGDRDQLPDRYAELLTDATKVEYTPIDSLVDVDAGFYASSYLRAWMLEAQLARYLREEYGRAWFAERRAGSLLRELWHEGQSMSADRLADEVMGQTLELDALAEGLRERLTA